MTRLGWPSRVICSDTQTNQKKRPSRERQREFDAKSFVSSTLYKRRCSTDSIEHFLITRDSTDYPSSLFVLSRFREPRVREPVGRVGRLGRTGAEARAWYRERTRSVARRHAERTQSLEARRRASVVARRCAFRADDVHRLFALGRGCALLGENLGARVVVVPLEVRLPRMTPRPSILDIAGDDPPRGGRPANRTPPVPLSTATISSARLEYSSFRRQKASVSARSRRLTSFTRSNETGLTSTAGSVSCPRTPAGTSTTCTAWS